MVCVFWNDVYRKFFVAKLKISKEIELFCGELLFGYTKRSFFMQSKELGFLVFL